MAHTSTALSAPDAVPRVPGCGPGECGLVRDRFSLCTQQLKWCAVDESSLIVSYVMSTVAVGHVILDDKCTIVMRRASEAILFFLGFPRKKKPLHNGSYEHKVPKNKKQNKTS